jgi:hypothetical protein
VFYDHLDVAGVFVEVVDEPAICLLFTGSSTLGDVSLGNTLGYLRMH